jgi:hypothetical protein
MKTLFPALLTGCFLTLGSYAQVNVISYSGTGQVTSNMDLGGIGLFDTNAPISPATDYAGPRFFGGVATSDATNAPISEWRIFNDLFFGNIPLTSDWIGVATPSTLIGPAKHHYAFLHFRQADFADLSTLAGGVRLNADTSLSFRARRTGGNPSFARFVVETDAGFFVSSSTELTAGQANGVELIVLADPTSTNWFAYDPDASLSVIGGAASPDLNNVVGLGIWFDNVRAGDATSGMGFYVTDIQLTAIPEPRTYAALFGLLALGAVVWRRRKTA